MRMRGVHMTNPARPGGPERKKPTPTAPPPPPAWRNWLIVAGVLLTLFLLYNNLGRVTKPTELNYSQFISRVDDDQVKTVSIDSTGAVTGTLKDGTDFESQLV